MDPSSSKAGIPILRTQGRLRFSGPPFVHSQKPNQQPAKHMIHIPSEPLKVAGRLLKRLRLRQPALPVLDHILVEAGSDGVVRLTVTTLDQWLETRIPGDDGPSCPESLLLPFAALDVALKGDRRTSVTLSRSGSRLHLSVVRSGITIETEYPVLDPAEFPACPTVPRRMHPTIVPGHTLEMIGEVAGCASKDATRYILNSVLLTDEDGGRVVATDGRRLALAPAEVPRARIAVPATAVAVLAHPDFRADSVTMTPFLKPADSVEGKRLNKKATDQAPDHLRLESGDHTLVTRLIDGRFPDWKQVIPREHHASVTFAECHRAAVIGWLRSAGRRGKEVPVELRQEKPGLLKLSRGRATADGSRIEVPVEIDGRPQPVALNATYLADALEIGSRLCFLDEISPVVTRRGDGALCVVMPMRLGFSGRAAA